MKNRAIRDDHESVDTFILHDDQGNVYRAKGTRTSGSSRHREHSAYNAKKKRGQRGRTLLSLLIFCLGVGISLYPYVAQQINNVSATKLVAAYNAVLEEGSLESLEGTGEGGTAPAYADENYGDAVYGSIFIPKLSLELPIFVGSTEANLSKGIAHMEGTSLPTGGSSTHSVLAGHNGAVTNEWFTNIDQLEANDLFYIRNGGAVLTYSVVSIKIIEPSDPSALVIQRDRDLVTLLTCTDSGAQRLIVTGERVMG